jgi:hypothetical protein
VRPNDLATFRLIISSNLPDCITSRSRAAQNFAAVDACLAIGIRQIGRVTHQAAGGHVFTLSVDRWQRIACGEPNDLVPPDSKERARTNHHCAGANFLGCGEGGIDLAFGVRAQDINLLTNGASRLLHVVQLGIERWPSRI